MPGDSSDFSNQSLSGDKALIVLRRRVVPKPGVEPGYPYGRWYLKPVRLPVPPLRPEEWNGIIADQVRPVKVSKRKSAPV